MTQRRSDQHTPRVDEQLEHETRDVTTGAPVPSHTRDDRRQEDPAEQTSGGGGLEPGTPAGTSPEEVELRSAIATALRPHAFPAGRERLLEVAREEQAPDGVIAALRQLPDTVQFDVVEQVVEALGLHGEDPSHRA